MGAAAGNNQPRPPRVRPAGREPGEGYFGDPVLGLDSGREVWPGRARALLPGPRRRRRGCSPSPEVVGGPASRPPRRGPRRRGHRRWVTKPSRKSPQPPPQEASPSAYPSARPGPVTSSNPASRVRPVAAVAAWPRNRRQASHVTAGPRMQVVAGPTRRGQVGGHQPPTLKRADRPGGVVDATVGAHDQRRLDIGMAGVHDVVIGGPLDVDRRAGGDEPGDARPLGQSDPAVGVIDVEILKFR